MSKYIFRAHPGYQSGNKIECTDRNAKTTIDEHVVHGSKSNSESKVFKSKYISCTKNMGAATVYSLGKAKKLSASREPVVLIDYDELVKDGAKTYDLTDKEVRKEHLVNTIAFKYAPASRELLVEYEIPQHLIREIPTIYVDVLHAFECCRFDSSIGNNSKYNPKAYEIMSESLCDMIMQDDSRVIGVLSKIGFSKMEQDFIRDYYFSENPLSIKEMSDKYFSGNINLTECVRVKIVKEVAKSPAFKDMLHDKVLENNESLKGLDDIERNHLFVLLNKDNDINPVEQYVGLIADKMPMTVDRTDTTKCVFGSSLLRKVSESKPLDLPYTYEINPENPSEIIGKSIRACKLGKGEPIMVEKQDGQVKKFDSGKVNITKTNHEDYDDFGVL